MLVAAPDASKAADESESQFQWRLLYAVVRLLDDACDAGEHAMPAHVAAGACVALHEMARRGVRPMCSSLLQAICTQVCMGIMGARASRARDGPYAHAANMDVMYGCWMPAVVHVLVPCDLAL